MPQRGIRTHNLTLVERLGYTAGVGSRKLPTPRVQLHGLAAGLRLSDLPRAFRIVTHPGGRRGCGVNFLIGEHRRSEERGHPRSVERPYRQMICLA